MCKPSSLIESSQSKDFVVYLDRFVRDSRRDIDFNSLVKNCRLCTARTKELPVSSYGSFSSSVLILDSNPGCIQRAEGDALQWESPTLKMLSRWFSETSYSLQDCRISYAFHCSGCRSFANMSKCALWLNYELYHMSNLHTIVTLGEDAFHMIMGSSYPSVKDIYGKTYVVTLFGRQVRVLPLMHPWFLLKHTEFQQKTIDLFRNNFEV